MALICHSFWISLPHFSGFRWVINAAMLEEKLFECNFLNSLLTHRNCDVTRKITCNYTFNGKL